MRLALPLALVLVVALAVPVFAQREADGMRVVLEDPPRASVGSVTRSDRELQLVIRLGERTVRARLDAHALDHAQSGNGAVFATHTVTVAGGVLLLAHHDLDAFVDPPRFARSRWTEGWFFPAGVRSGESVSAVVLRGEQFHAGRARADGSVCVTDARGHTQRFEVRGRRLVPADASPCAREVAEQPEPVFVRERGAWHAEDEYLGIEHVDPLRTDLEALRVSWSDGGQYRDDESVPRDPSTRLVWRDPTGAVRWYYLDPRAHCRARLAGERIVCGPRSFRFDAGRLTAAEEGR